MTIQIKGLSALAVAMTVLLGITFLIKGQPITPVLVIAVGLQSMMVFWALLWALPRSNRAFFSIFVGDAMLRLLGLAVVAGWLWSRNLPYTGPLLTLAFTYLLLSFVQIPFFLRVR